MEITYELTASDLIKRDAYSSKLLDSRLKLMEWESSLIGLFIGIFFVLPAAFFIIRNNWSAIIFVAYLIGIAIAYVYIFSYLRKQKWKKSIDGLSSSNRKMTIKTNSTGLEVTGENISSLLDKGAIKGAVKVKEHLFLELSLNIFITVPLRAFQNNDQADEFLEFIRGG